MTDKRTTQEIEAEDLIEEMKTRLKAPTGIVACTPEAHAEVVGTERALLRAGIWQIRHANRTENGKAKLKIGPLQISGVAEARLYRLAALAILAWVFMRLWGFDPAVIKKVAEEVKDLKSKVTMLE
jgi:hypothetical protein